MSAFEIAAGATAFAVLAMTVREWRKGGLYQEEALAGTAAFFASVWFIARLMGAA